MRSTLSSLAVGCLLLFSLECRAHDAEAAELRSIREQVSLIRREQQRLAAVVDEIRGMLSGEVSQPKGIPLDGASISTLNVPPRGSEAARVGIMEFSDYQC